MAGAPSRVRDATAVAAALARLADQSAPHRPDHRRVVVDAEAAFRDVEDAATFLDRDGEERLRACVDAARRWGDDDVAARGEAVLERLRRFRAAAEADESEALAKESPSTDAAADQFHPGRTTLLGRDGIRGDR